MQKKLWQNSTPIYNKNSPESGHRGNISQHIKAIYDRPDSITLDGEKLKAFSSKIKNKTRMPILVLFNILLEHSSQRRKTNRWNSNWKRRSKTVTVCRWHTHVESPKDATRKWLELVNESGKVAGYKINTQKSVAFLYTNNERSERKNIQSHLPSHQKE